MAKTSRQTAIFGTEDWKRFYKTYEEADLQSYNFETLRKTFIDYLRQHHPESFNDYTESSEFVAMLDLMAFMGQALSFRNDLNTRENFMDTAERRDSVNNLAKLISYTPKRNVAASGYLKLLSASTTENIFDYNRNSLNNVTVLWNDKSNDAWQEQLTTIINAALVDSQKIGSPNNTANILGVRTDEYSVNIADGTLPVIPFASTVDGVSMDFEVINGTSINSDFVYEPAPRLNGNLNMLYRNDSQGFASVNTGYFFYFKQGTLQTQDFSLSERITNRSIDINIDGINNDDIWLYSIDSTAAEVSDLWGEVGNIYAPNSSAANSNDRKFFSVSSRAEDQITLNFGDGVFSEIPIGDYRSYVRQSNGLEYIINPEEIQNLTIAFNYISRHGRLEELTLTLGLTVPVSNAKNNEKIDDIKRRAPANFYTQNRMVNGEDYNNFPYTSNSSIIKSKALNRTNVGASRYLDLVDPTGKYSSINAYGSDGLLFNEQGLKTFNFTFNNKNDIDSVIRNKIEPLLASRGMVHYYYENYDRVELSQLAGPAVGVSWFQSTSVTNETTGHFQITTSGLPVPIGETATGTLQQLTGHSLVKFVAPFDQHFNTNNRLEQGISTTAEDRDYIWATILNLENDGTNFNNAHNETGVGPVTINNFVPTGAIPVEIIPVFNTNLPLDIETLIVEQIELNRPFGLKFNHLINTWALELDPAELLDTSDWLVKFEPTPSEYIVSTRTLNYFFSSVLETRFYYDGNQQIFDPRTGKIVDDFIRVLSTNKKPGPENVSLSGDVTLDIIGQSVESDGYVNDYKVEVSYTDSDRDGIADDPDFFKELVAQGAQVYFERTVDFDNLERYLPLNENLVNAEYSTKVKIEEIKTQHSNGQIFYASNAGLLVEGIPTGAFFELVVNGNVRNVIEKTNIEIKSGRGAIHFQYRHNSPETTRINPSVTNIIDLYVVVANYYNAFVHYMQDSTDTVKEPAVPTTDELTVQYSKLQENKMVSDNIVLNSVKFKPLFGNKAEESLQAYIKVVKLKNSITSDSEIKSQVISTINEYFEIDNWDFGDTFYFSELSAYIHSKIGDVVGSVVIIPKDDDSVFGELYEIRSAPHEIFTSAATVNDVVILDSLTISKLQNKA